jgi:Sulfotransferase family
MTKPLILHCHIPKTAGVSVSRILSNGFEYSHFNHYHPDPNFVLTPSALERLLEIDPWLQSISSHSLRKFPQRIAGRPVYYITFLRNPTDLFVSVLRYTQQQFNNLSPESLQPWPQETPQLSLRDLAATALQMCGENRYAAISEFFCEREIREELNHMGIDDPQRAWQQVTGLILQRFFFVGIVEEMPKSIKLLKAKLAKLGRYVKPPLLCHLNRTRGVKNTSWLNTKDPVGAKLLEATAFDRLLYERFYQKFRAEYKTLEHEGHIADPPGELEGYSSLEEWAFSTYRATRDTSHAAPAAPKPPETVEERKVPA